MHFAPGRDTFLTRMGRAIAREVEGRAAGVERPAARGASRGAAGDDPAPESPLPVPVAHARSGFTLIELLTVIAIIGVLVSIMIGVGRGVQERAAIGKARAELAVLAAALEQYKLQYGDYPWTPEESETQPYDGGTFLFNALCGNLGPRGEKLAVKGRAFVDLAKFELDTYESAKMPDPTDPKVVMNWFNDPWGERIWYYYRKGPLSGSNADTKWKSPSFLLYSHGPDGECDTEVAKETGLLSDIPNDPDNADNIYAGH